MKSAAERKYFKMDKTCWIVGLLALVICSVKSEFTAEFIDRNPKHLLLTCSTRALSQGSEVISIKIYNRTTSHILAWVKNTGNDDGNPKFSNASYSWGKYVSGTLQRGDLKNSRLELLLLNNDPSVRAFYGCRISVMGHLAQIEDIELSADTEISVDNRLVGVKESTPAPKKTTEAAQETEVRTGSVLQPTVLDAGVPLSVLIVMLVLIIVLTIITSALLLQKFRGRCCTPELPYPPSPHYAIAGEGLESSWEERLAMKGSRPSLHNMALLRSHYSLPRPLQPPPPPPKLHRSRSTNSRDGSDYMASQMRVPGMTRSMYTTPYDAIAQDSSEEGDLSLLNTSGHDLTPSLPPEMAGEPTYKVPRSAEAQVQTSGHGHNLYSTGPANGHVPLDCPA